MKARVRFRLSEDALAPSLGQIRGADGVWEITAQDPTGPLHELTGWALEHGLALDALEVIRPSLEDVYLALTGDEAEREVDA